MRNFYESELGFFEGAYRPKATTFREEIKEVLEKFDDQKDQKILYTVLVGYAVKRPVPICSNRASRM